MKLKNKILLSITTLSLSTPIVSISGCSDLQNKYDIQVQTDEGIQLDITKNNKGEDINAIVTTDGKDIGEIIIKDGENQLDEGKDYLLTANRLVIYTKSINSGNISIKIRAIVYEKSMNITTDQDIVITLSYENLNLQYNIDGTWNDVSTSQIQLPAGETIKFKGNNPNGFGDTKPKFSFGKADTTFQQPHVKLSGNILALLDNGTGTLRSTIGSKTFNYTFSDNKFLTEVSDFFLPAAQLTDGCYQYLFQNCTFLTKTPLLPARAIKESSYQYMFRGCYSLQEAPVLPAQILGDYCYYYMFAECHSLNKIHSLPAENVVDDAYENMFENCDSLKEAAYTCAKRIDYCGMYYMYKDCESLVDANDMLINSESIRDYGCCGTFYNCHSLKKSPALPAMNLSEGAYYDMFYDCYSLKVAPAILPAKFVPTYCYYEMFKYCYSLTKAPMLYFENFYSENDENYSFYDMFCETLINEVRLTYKGYLGYNDCCDWLDTYDDAPGTLYFDGSYDSYIVPDNWSVVPYEE